MKRKHFALSALLLLALVVTGCATADYTKPIATFQENVDTTGAIIAEYYMEMNDFEREIYLNSCVCDPNKNVSMKDLNERKFSTESIRARLDAISVLRIYASRLAELAGSDAPAQFRDKTELLGENLVKLDETFAGLSGMGDDTAKNYVGPISQLVGVIGEEIIIRQRDKKLETAIKKGREPVNNLLALLENDMIASIDRLQTTGVQQMLAEKINYYNENKDKMNDNQRKKCLMDISDCSTRYQRLVSSSPSSVVNEIRMAHNAIVKYAKSDKKPQDVAALAGSMEAFEGRVSSIAAIFQELKNLD